MAEKTSRTFDKPAEQALLLFIIIIAVVGLCVPLALSLYYFFAFFRREIISAKRARSAGHASRGKAPSSF